MHIYIPQRGFKELLVTLGMVHVRRINFGINLVPSMRFKNLDLANFIVPCDIK